VIRLYRLGGLRRWWQTRRCRHIASTYSQIIDSGRRKLWWCTRCGSTWTS